jgi:hypothetical protein
MLDTISAEELQALIIAAQRNLYCQFPKRS